MYFNNHSNQGTGIFFTEALRFVSMIAINIKSRNQDQLVLKQQWQVLHIFII